MKDSIYWMNRICKIYLNFIEFWKKEIYINKRDKIINFRSSFYALTDWAVGVDDVFWCLTVDTFWKGVTLAVIDLFYTIASVLNSY